MLLAADATEAASLAAAAQPDATESAMAAAAHLRAAKNCFFAYIPLCFVFCPVVYPAEYVARSVQKTKTACPPHRGATPSIRSLHRWFALWEESMH